MSRIGNKSITVPAGVEITVDNGAVVVKGPKGTLTQKIAPTMQLKLEDGVLTVARPNDSKENKSLHGLTRTLVSNMVIGVTDANKRETARIGKSSRNTLLLWRRNSKKASEKAPEKGSKSHERPGNLRSIRKRQT